MYTSRSSFGKYVVDCVLTNGSIVLIIVAGCNVSAAEGFFDAYRITKLQIMAGFSLKIITSLLV